MPKKRKFPKLPRAEATMPFEVGDRVIIAGRDRATISEVIREDDEWVLGLLYNDGGVRSLRWVLWGRVEIKPDHRMSVADELAMIRR